MTDSVPAQPRKAVAPDSSANQTSQSGQDATRLIEQGQALEAQGKPDEAMQCYLEAIRLAPNPARAHLNRGNLLLSQGDLPGALQAFRAAIEHKPDYAGAYYNIGNALLSDGQFDEAAANYRRALEIQPDYAEVHCVLGIALKELGQVDDAIASFKTALRINPELVEAHLNLGSLLLSQGRYIEAWPEYEVRYDPNYSGRLFFFFGYDTIRNTGTVTGGGWYDTSSLDSSAPTGSIASKFTGIKGAGVVYQSVLEGPSDHHQCVDVGLIQGVNCNWIQGQGLDLGKPLTIGLGNHDPSFANPVTTTSGKVYTPGLGGNGSGSYAANMDGNCRSVLRVDCWPQQHDQ